MIFELNDYKKELTDEEILQDIKTVASSLGTDYISVSLYKKHGQYSQTAIRGHFGTWKNALAIAGLRTERTPDERCRVSNEDLFEDLRRVAKDLQSDTVTYDSYKKYGKYSDEVFFRRFGKWNNALLKAGLKGTGFSKDKITEQQCFDEIERIWIQLGRQPTSTDIIKNGVPVHAPVTPEILLTIFYPGTRLHDGAVVIHGNEIVAASVFFTPTTKPFAGKYGSRHRAAIGISEISDAITVVVSEETGRISFAVNGELEAVNQTNFLRVFENYMADNSSDE